jgi:hypothetical protein
MQVTVSDTAEKKTIYTEEEKYGYLRSVNPAVDRLVQEFKLTLS